jgi:pyrimidine deaminase RibD-like protein
MACVEPFCKIDLVMTVNCYYTFVTGGSVPLPIYTPLVLVAAHTSLAQDTVDSRQTACMDLSVVLRSLDLAVRKSNTVAEPTRPNKVAAMWLQQKRIVHTMSDTVCGKSFPGMTAVRRALAARRKHYGLTDSSYLLSFLSHRLNRLTCGSVADCEIHPCSRAIWRSSGVSSPCASSKLCSRPANIIQR